MKFLILKTNDDIKKKLVEITFLNQLDMFFYIIKSQIVLFLSKKKEFFLLIFISLVYICYTKYASTFWTLEYKIQTFHLASESTFVLFIILVMLWNWVISEMKMVMNIVFVFTFLFKIVEKIIFIYKIRLLNKEKKSKFKKKLVK